MTPLSITTNSKQAMNENTQNETPVEQTTAPADRGIYCKTCRIFHPKENFTPDRRTPRGYSQSCRDAARRKRESYHRTSRSVKTPDHKRCRVCGKYLPKASFRVGYGKDGLFGTCIECEQKLAVKKLAAQNEMVNGDHDHGVRPDSSLHTANKKWFCHHASFKEVELEERAWLRDKAKVFPNQIGDMAYAYAVHMGWIKPVEAIE